MSIPVIAGGLMCLFILPILGIVCLKSAPEEQQPFNDYTNIQ